MEDLFEIKAAQAVGDYIDEEGYLCCGNCNTRKQYRIPWPFFDGKGSMGEHLVPVLCRCKQEEKARMEAEQKAREHRELVARLQSVCFTSPTRREHTFENATMLPPDILEKAKRFVEDWPTVRRENTGQLYWGDCGTGKSYTAACIANALMEQEIPVLMRNLGDFMGGSFEDKEELCRDVARYGLVIFDDLGMERATEYGLEMVYRVINARYESGKPTIFTTNLSLQDLMNPQDIAHKRIYDRVLEMTIPIQFTGPNVRPKIRQHKMNIFRKILKGGQ